MGLRRFLGLKPAGGRKVPLRNEAPDSPHCPLCNSDQFDDFLGLSAEMCAHCRSLGRSRLAFLTLQRLDLLVAGGSVLHFAPEIGLSARLHQVFGRGYAACDIEARHLTIAPGRHLVMDLCNPTPDFLAGRYDILVHSHVLEHLPCNWSLAFLQLHQMVKPGGAHVFSVPMQSDYTREDLRPDMDGAERESTFGQCDHMRTFGRKDFQREFEKIAALTASTPLVARSLFSEVEIKLHRLSGHVFVLRPG